MEKVALAAFFIARHFPLFDASVQNIDIFRKFLMILYYS